MQSRPFEILLIEDNQADIDLTRAAIADCKTLSNLHISKKGQEALRFLNRTEEFSKALRPDLIFLDLNLPNTDGREVLGQIKSDPHLRQIPVIILTSSQSELDILKSYSMGANCYLLKPLDSDHFSWMIQQVLSFWCLNAQLPQNTLVERPRVAPYKAALSRAGKKDVGVALKVLLIEDSDTDAEMVFENLSQLSEPRCFLHRESRLDDSLKYLESNTPDVVLLDLSLPDSQGLETVHRFHALHPLLPFVILTGAGEKSLGIQAIADGADDYLVKGEVQDELLVRTLRYAIERKVISSELLNALANEKTARIEAEKATAIRDEFLSIAAHELRTPLTSLKLQFEFFVRTIARFEKETIDKQFVPEFAEKTNRHIDRFSKLIDSLLNFSQIQSGRLKLDYVKFELNQMIRNSLERFTIELEKAGCELILELHEPVDGDWDLLRLEQVMTNLVSNAIKYAPGKPITVSVTSTADKVSIEVKDQGLGIAPRDQDKIFQRFERVEKTKTSPGLGLGLYIVNQIIDMHGGTIQLESEVEVGSTFKINLPRWRF